MINRLITKNPVFPLFFASAIAYLQGPFMALWSDWAKLILALGIYISLLFIPYIIIRKNKLEFSKFILVCYSILLLMVGISLYNGLTFPAFNTGNKYVTLFCNGICLPLLFPPVFAFCATQGNMERLLKCSKWILYILIIYTFIIGEYGLANCLLWIPAFFPFLRKKNKLVLIIALFAVLYTGIVGVAGTRKYFILLAFVVVYLGMRFLHLGDRLYRYCGIVLLAGVSFFAVNMIRSAHNPDRQFLGSLMESLKLKNISTTDTRTFLYIETFADLINTNTLWLGKGAYSYIYSPFFENAEGDGSKRLGIEVPFLIMMQRAGIVYTFTYLLIILYGIKNALWNSRNQFLRTVAIMQIGYLFLFFVGDINGCSFFHLGFWILTGCTFSKTWINMTDEDVVKIFINTKVPKNEKNRNCIRV